MYLVPCLTPLVAGLSLRRAEIDLWPEMGFVVENVALGQILLRVLPYSLVSKIPPTLYTHSVISHRYDVVCATNVVK
jgi:hypothetical protein